MTREAHPRERAVGIERYVSETGGIGGRLRAEPEAFRVRELEAFDHEPLAADPDPDAHPHLVCRVTLRDWDTNDFARRLSDALSASRERVSWAGTKDKRAVTTQLVTVRDADPGDLPDVRAAEVEPVGRAGRAIGFGDLAGNAFSIRVRDAAPDARDRIRAIVGELCEFAAAGETDADRSGDPGSDDAGGDDPEASWIADAPIGLPNYFGQQRFGSRRPVTHEVGLALVRGDPREAVRLYAGNPFDTEPGASRRARAVVDREFASPSPDWEACLDAMPDRLRFERTMLAELAARDAGADAPDGDWLAALSAVPSNLRRLFVHAAQSALFNRIVSRRLDRGLPFASPVPGDVVCFVDPDDAAPDAPDAPDAPTTVASPDPDRCSRATADRIDTLRRHCGRGRAFVTAPLTGTDSDLGAGVPGEIERAVLNGVGVEPADFDLPGAFGSAGTRRAVLLRTALTVDPGPTFRFALPPGAYATVVLREFLKTDPEAL